MAGSCERGNEFLCSIKRGKLIDQLSDYLFNKDSASWSWVMVTFFDL
jgi:hypothetical protein